MLRVLLFWVERGVRIFRVDNPHTKPPDFWQWLIWQVKDRHPDVLFLAQRPRGSTGWPGLGSCSNSCVPTAWPRARRRVSRGVCAMSPTVRSP